jgi:beta-glucosidase
LTEKELGFYNNEGNYLVESGTFKIMVGGSSDKGLEGSFELK